jgi:hypothetical protein
VALEETLERGGQGGRGQAGNPGAHRTARALGQRDSPVRQCGLGVGGDVLPWYLGQHTDRHAEERADLIQGMRGLVDQPAVAQYKDLLPREERKQVLQLLPVAAEPQVVPEAGPAGRDPALLLAAGADKVGDGLQAGRP